MDNTNKRELENLNRSMKDLARTFEKQNAILSGFCKKIAPVVDEIMKQVKEEKELAIDRGRTFSITIDKSNPAHDDDNDYMLGLLHAYELHFNDVLESYGFVTVNDIYRLFCIPRTTEGMTYGWIYKTFKKDQIKFDTKIKKTLIDEGEWESTYIIDLVTDGNIYEIMKGDMELDDEDKNEDKTSFDRIDYWDYINGDSFLSSGGQDSSKDGLQDREDQD